MGQHLPDDLFGDLSEHEARQVLLHLVALDLRLADVHHLVDDRHVGHRSAEVDDLQLALVMVLESSAQDVDGFLVLEAQAGGR